MCAISDHINKILAQLSMKQGGKESAISKTKRQSSRHDRKARSQKAKKIAKPTSVGRPSKKNKNKKGDACQEQIQSLTPQSNQQATQAPNDLIESISDKIMMNLIDFFDKTKQKKGFVYGKDARLKFNRETGTRWSLEYRWDKQTEEAKIREIMAERDELGEEQQKKIRRVMLETSGISSEEFTKEYYDIVLEVYSHLLALRESQEEELAPFNELAETIHSNKDDRFPFYSYEFRAKVNLKDQFQMPANSQHYRTLILSLREELLKL